MPYHTLTLNSAAEYDAVLAALRLLATALNSMPQIAEMVMDIHTNMDKHLGLSSDQVHDIADRLLED